MTEFHSVYAFFLSYSCEALIDPIQFKGSDRDRAPEETSSVRTDKMRNKERFPLESYFYQLLRFC